MPYNLTLVANSSGIVPLLQNVNTELMRGYFGILILLSLWVITFMAFIVSTNGDGMKSTAASSFFVFIAAVLLRGLGIVPDIALLITIVLTALSVFLIKNY